jgi:hypothetical protein
MAYLSDINKGLSFSAPSRTRGPVNPLRWIDLPMTRGDALPINGIARKTDSGIVGGLPDRTFQLPTDKEFTNFPIINTQQTKDIMSSIRRAYSTKNRLLAPIVKPQEGLNQLLLAQMFNVIVQWRFPYKPHMIRGKIVGSKYKPSIPGVDYRGRVIPSQNPLTYPQDLDIPKRNAPPSKDQDTIHKHTIDVAKATQNPVLTASVGSQVSATAEQPANQTVFLLVVAVLGFFIIRKMR